MEVPIVERETSHSSHNISGFNICPCSKACPHSTLCSFKARA